MVWKIKRKSCFPPFGLLAHLFSFTAHSLSFSSWASQTRAATASTPPRFPLLSTMQDPAVRSIPSLQLLSFSYRNAQMATARPCSPLHHVLPPRLALFGCARAMPSLPRYHFAFSLPRFPLSRVQKPPTKLPDLPYVVPANRATSDPTLRAGELAIPSYLFPSILWLFSWLLVPSP